MNEIDLIVSLANSYQSKIDFESEPIEHDVKITIKKDFYKDLVNLVPEKVTMRKIPTDLTVSDEVEVEDTPRKNWELVQRWNGWTYLSIQYRDFQKGWFVTHDIDGKNEYRFVQEVSRISRTWLLNKIEFVKKELDEQNKRMKQFYQEYPHQFFREIYTEDFHQTYNSKGEKTPPFYPTVHVLDVNRKIWYYYDGILYNSVTFNLRDVVHHNTEKESCYETSENCDDILEASIAFEQDIVMKTLGSVEVLANMPSEFKDEIVSHVRRQKIEFRESNEGIAKGF